MSWLQLFADAGCLTDEQQVQAEAAVRDYTRALAEVPQGGRATSRVRSDGVYGPDTVDAVETLQKTHGLPVTGTVDKATADALQADLAAKGRRRRAGGRGVDLRGPADTQARRLLGRAGRRGVDTGPDRTR
jgi:peptidoglycan hydrolase-like protein with peptidoglycan-binding domain